MAKRITKDEALKLARAIFGDDVNVTTHRRKSAIPGRYFDTVYSLHRPRRTLAQSTFGFAHAIWTACCKPQLAGVRRDASAREAMVEVAAFAGILPKIRDGVIHAAMGAPVELDTPGDDGDEVDAGAEVR